MAFPIAALTGLLVSLLSAQIGRSDAAIGVTDMRTRMQPLRAIVGSFTLEASETATDQSTFRETGTRECRWILGETAILCEDARTLREARGRYVQLPANRRSMMTFRWNAADSSYEQVDIGVTGAPGVRRLTHDPSAGKLSYDSVVESQSVGQTLDSTSLMTIYTDGHAVTQTLRSRTSTFQEEYRETATRKR